ncbi:hypothetical protein JFU48_17695 [Pseudomonas sp. TH49]|uniref:hypothetical protein n=1 Tax=Pseudomonas sp. TH49 TaxID=2796413 RepID=UPI001912DE61|nr:hypothetical protein [Pseudomonas sp. TH49]MBK5343204.1 hypothetical protein [Pseudomonas sp. TH49]
MTTTNIEYGITVVEFFKHSEEELQKIIKEKETAYFRHCMSPAYPELGVNVDWFSDRPLALALNDLTEWVLKGYTVASALNRPLYLKIQLRKPQAIIDADLIDVAEQAITEYEQHRYERNLAEQVRQIEFTVARKVREAEAAAAQAAADKSATIHDAALSDLLAAYAKPTKPKTKKADEVAA